MTGATCQTAVAGSSCDATGLSVSVVERSLVSIRFEEIGGTTSGHGTCSIKYTADS